jgi:GT2 family glycosyltransferase
MKCDIVIPVWNNKEVTQRCLESIFDNTHCEYRLIIIDNASDASTRQYLDQVKLSRPDKVLLIANEENVGFTKAVNQGIKVSSSDYVCINNNDIIVSDGWLEEMIYVAEGHSDIGIVNPSSNFGKRKPWGKTFKQYANSRTFGKHGQYSETASPVGFCYLIKREVIDKIGLLDEGYSPGYFEDTDYALRAKAAGYKSVFANGAFVFHLERASFKKRGFNPLFKQSEERFYSLHKRPRRILYVLVDPAVTFSQRIKEDSYNFAKDANWVSIFLKRSAPNIELYNHTYIRVFRFADIFFNIAVIWKVLFKKKKFSKILVDNEGFAQRFRMLKRYHKAQVEVL